MSVVDVPVVAPVEDPFLTETPCSVAIDRLIREVRMGRWCRDWTMNTQGQRCMLGLITSFVY